MIFIIEVFFAVLFGMGAISLIVMLWDAGSWLRRRLRGQPQAETGPLPEEIAAIENRKSGDDGSFDFD